MLSPEEFEAEYGDRLDDELPDRPVSTLRDIQYLYGRLYTLANPEGGEFSAYLTPDESQDIRDEPESLIALCIDLAEDSTAILADDPVDVRTLTEDLVPAVAHCDYDSSAGIDHSVTHRTGQDKAPKKISGYLVDRLTRWATDEVVADAAADHEDGWIVDALAQLGEDESLPERVEDATEAQLDGKTTALTTVLVRPPDAEKYFYPGELATEQAGPHRTDVFQVAMRARKLSKLVDKNAADDSSGEAIDLLTGETARTIGMAEDPLNYYLGKQHGSFPGLDPEEAWRAHPLSEDSAVMLIGSKTFVKSCSYQALNLRVYYLPYFFGRPTAEKAFALYDILYAVYQNNDLTPVEQAYQVYTGDSTFGIDSSHELRFYVGAIQYQHENRFDVFGDTLDGSLVYPVDLSNAHEAVVESPLFADTESPRNAPLPTHPDWDLLSPSTQLKSIATGWYLTQTFPDLDPDEETSSDDYRIEALVGILSGEPLLVEELLREYTDALTDAESDDPPSLTVASQFAQLSALAEAGLLDTNDPRYEPLTRPPTYDSPTTMTHADEIRADGGHAALNREAKLESFIDGTPAIREDPQRKAAFLLGALVGHVSGYQEASENRATTLVDQHPIKGLTVRKFKRTLQEALDKNVVYSRDNRMSSTMYAEVVDELRAAVAASEADPDEWEIDTTDLRFYYSLGITYGLNDYEPDNESSDEATTDAAEEV